MVVGTGRLYPTQTGETSFQETTRRRGRSTSAVAGRSRRPVEFENRQRVCRHFIRTMTDESITEDFTAAAAATAVIEEEDSTDAQSEKDSTPWHLFGTVSPREEIVFLCQVVVLYTVILTSIYNLTTGHENSNLWTALLSSSLGYLLPNPTLRRHDE